MEAILIDTGKKKKKRGGKQVRLINPDIIYSMFNKEFYDMSEVQRIIGYTKQKMLNVLKKEKIRPIKVELLRNKDVIEIVRKYGKVVKVRDVVGYDGQSYYCLRCGKAGFQSEASVIGHQNFCPERKKIYEE